MKIEGCVALVTGANRGLGQAIVAALLEAGASKIYATARDARQLPEGPRVAPLALDITRADQIEAAARKAGDVNLLINNAGVLSSFNVLTAEKAELDADFRTHVHGTLAMIKAFVPVLERGRGGTIVNVLSLGALASIPSFGGYSASKAAAYSITQALRPELRKKGIEMLAALPGPIDTDMVKGFELPKSSPAEVARELVAGVARGEEEIFPDPMAREMAALWNRSHKEVERAFSAF